MYITLSVIILMIIGIIVIIVTLNTKENPEFNNQRSDNFNNVMYYQGSYKNQDLKISPEFDWVEFQNTKYLLNGKEYRSGNKFIKFKDHPFYYIDKPVMSGNIKNSHNIPKIIWQTMKEEPTKGKIYDCVQTFKQQKDWEYRFVSDEDAKLFLKDNFDSEVLHAFEVLIPGAFKADLLRACLLYIHGGVYADAKLILHYDLDAFINNDLVLVRDIDYSDTFIWNGFIASTPKNVFFKKVISNIVENVKNMDHTDHYLNISGPKMYGRTFLKLKNIPKLELGCYDSYTILSIPRLRNHKHKFINSNDNHELFMTWDSSRSYTKNWATKDYGVLWWNKSVFDKQLHKKYFN